LAAWLIKIWYYDQLNVAIITGRTCAACSAQGIIYSTITHATFNRNNKSQLYEISESSYLYL